MLVSLGEIETLRRAAAGMLQFREGVRQSFAEESRRLEEMVAQVHSKWVQSNQVLQVCSRRTLECQNQYDTARAYLSQCQENLACAIKREEEQKYHV